MKHLILLVILVLGTQITFAQDTTSISTITETERINDIEGLELGLKALEELKKELF